MMMLRLLLMGSTAVAQHDAVHRISPRFLHGVASGDPWSESIVLWTRVTPQAAALDPVASATFNVSWTVWKSSDNTHVRTGFVVTSEDSDWTVKTIVGGLEPGVKYAYAFTAGDGRWSPVGRFKLFPPHSERLESLRYAIFSCSNWGWGYFNVYRAVADAAKLDLWLHVGDWMYQDGQDADGYPTAEQAVRWDGMQPTHATVSLDDYRKRHALTRADPDTQALSALAPLIAVWDDHEITNDPWVGGAQDHDESTEGDWWTRKRNAIKAYHEWMPTRVTPPAACVSGVSCAQTHEGEHIYRQFSFGDLATLILLETRLLARSPQRGPTLPDTATLTTRLQDVVANVAPDRWASDANFAATISALRAEWSSVRNAFGRDLMGAAQLEWLREAVANATRRGSIWQLLAQQIVVQPRNGPDLAGAAAAAAAAGGGEDNGKGRRWQQTLYNLTSAPLLGNATVGAPTVQSFDFQPFAPHPLGSRMAVTSAMRTSARALLAQAQFGLDPDFDGWAGYPAARGRLLSALAQEPSGRVAVYAGDSHCAWAGSLRSPNGTHVALEFDGTGVSSSGWESWAPWLDPELAARGYVRATPSLKYASMNRRGWIEVSLTRERHEVSFMYVSSVASRQDFSVGCDASFLQSADTPADLQRVPCDSSTIAAAYRKAGGASALGRGGEGLDGAHHGIIGALIGGAIGAACTALAIGAGCLVGRNTKTCCAPKRAKPFTNEVSVEAVTVASAPSALNDPAAQ